MIIAILGMMACLATLTFFVQCSYIAILTSNENCGVATKHVIVPFLLFFCFVISAFGTESWMKAGSNAKFLNAIYGTEFTQTEMFLSGDIIENHLLERLDLSYLKYLNER